MIRLYCKHHLHADTLPNDYEQLLTYAHHRLDHCRFGEKKTSCKQCPVHCYAPKQRQLMRQVMKWCGPRMLLYHPVLAIRHLFYI